MAFADAVWTHYAYIKTRIAQKNPARQVKGILNAIDWPSKPMVFDAFYLLVGDDVPIGSQGYSQYSPMVFHAVQWVFVVKGTDLACEEKSANRGDRFVTAQNMRGELLYGCVPGYTEKLTWAMNQSNGKFVGSSFPMRESITWTPISFRDRQDKVSGYSFSTGSLRIWDCTDVISS